MVASASSLSTISSLYTQNPPRLSHPPSSHHSLSPLKPPKFSLFLLPKPKKINPINATFPDTDTIYFDNIDPEEISTFNPPERPEDFVPPPSFDEGPFETEDEVAKGYEEIYGVANSGETFLGNDIYVMDSKVKKTIGFGSQGKREKVKYGFDERVVQVRRVTKVVKGGKQLHFRAVVVVVDKKGQVGVGVGKAKEVAVAIQKSAVNARRLCL